LISLINGIIIAQTSGPEVLNEQFVQFKPYRQMHYNPEEIWDIPEDGLLGGEIILLKKEYLNLMDSQNNQWDVDIRKAQIYGKKPLMPKSIIKIIGDQRGEFKFEAEIIKPMGMRIE